MRPWCLLVVLAVVPAPAWADRPPPPPLFPGPTAPPARPAARPWLGIAMDETPAGVVVREVIPGSPAEAARLQDGDLVEAVGGRTVRSAPDVLEGVLGAGVGADLTVRVLRAGARVQVVVRLAAAPAGPGGLHQARFVGRPAPAIEATASTSGPIPTNAGLLGRVTVIDFWATWCRPCRAPMTTFGNWHRRWSGRGLQIVGLTDEDPALVAQFAQAAGVPYTLATDAGSRTARRYAISAIPTMFIVDRGGVVRSVSVGVSPADLRDSEALIERLLAEPVPAPSPGEPTAPPRSPRSRAPNGPPPPSRD